MPLMLRRFSIPILILAALIVAEPLLHSHPLQQNSIPNTCPVCATGVGRLPSVAPSIAAPCLIAYTLIALTVNAVIVPVILSVPSRAPPVL